MCRDWKGFAPVWRAMLAMCICLMYSTSVRANEFLPPEQAFRFSVAVQDPACTADCLLDVTARVAPEYYLYRERFALQNLAGLDRLEFVELPRGERKYDEFLKQDIEALRGDLSFQIVYSFKPGQLGAQDKPFANLVSQGCADAGLCYPPMTTPLSQSSGGLLGGALGAGKTALTEFFGQAAQSTASGTAPTDVALGAGAPSDSSSVAADGVVDEAGALASRLAGQSAWVVLPVFFGLGLLLAFTPCTLPMLPIVSSLVVGQQLGEQAGRAKPMALALVYVLGMSLTYAVLGVVAGLTGQSLVMAMQQPPVLWAFSGVLVLLGLALLMGYSLQLPSGFQSWIQEKTGRFKGGQFVPVLIMGVLSALLLGPCVAPPLAGALLFIGQTGDAVLGGAALFLLALGMGLPLVLFAAGAGAAVPKAGLWMSWVSAAFGFLLLAVAVWTATPVTPVPVVMALWAFLGALLAAALFHGARDGFGLKTRGQVLAKTLGLVVATLAVVYGVGALSRSGDLLNPLRGVSYPASGAVQAENKASHVPFKRVGSAEALDTLRKSAKPVMLDFYADWCVSCKEFELFTLSDSNVKTRLAGIEMLQVDVTPNSPDDQALLKHFKLFGPPAILFFPAGQDVEIHRVIGFQNAKRFTATLDEVRPGLGL